MGNAITFKFCGGDADQLTLPVDYLINLLEGMRDISYLALAQKDGVIYSERFRPSKQIKERVTIACMPAQPGSFSQTLVFLTPDIQQSFFEDDAKYVCSTIKDVLNDLAEKKQHKITGIFPNNKLRLKMLESIRKALPPLDSNLVVEVDNQSAVNSKAILSSCIRLADREQSVIEEYMTVINGRLIGIDFDMRKMTIQHPLTRKSLDCFYNEKVESMLLENPRDLVQIVGNVLLDDNDMPFRITDAISIHEIDLSPIECVQIKSDGLNLVFKEPLSFNLSLDESQQLFTLNYDPLGIDLFAYTRNEIIDDLESELVFLWREYALAPDSELTDNALGLKKNLLAVLEAFDEQ